MSPRTSVHIHANCRDFTWDQIKTIILLYSIFEHHFYNIAGKIERTVFSVYHYIKQNLLKLIIFEFRTFNMVQILWNKHITINRIWYN